MTNESKILVLLVTLLLGAPAIRAQEPPADEAQNPAGEVVQEAAPEVQEQASQNEIAKPSDDVMRPTRTGFRLTPGFAEMLTRQWIKNDLARDVVLADKQREQLVQKISGKVMELGHREEQNGREFFEQAIESVLSGPKSMTPERQQEFGRRLSELLPSVESFMKDVARESRPLLSDSQWQGFKENLRRQFRNFEQIEKKAKRWAEGGAREGETLHDFDNEDEPPDGLSEQEQKTWSRMQHVRRRVERDMRQLGGEQWAGFLASAGTFFGFDADQQTRGKTLLEDYRLRARTIMTADWRKKIRENRFRYHLAQRVGRGDVAPWLYHLEREFAELTGPLDELEDGFRAAVIALATPDQRSQAVETVRQEAAKHGMDVEGLDASWFDAVGQSQER